eukprot:CAMPEP_0185569358 /NCGR_PEP_ID=MMETSP0434-20130131/2003_1 /TAXON_ID=626734 ORGANISM="Favella taraikaensis, Strain Fe Narragansett Bay" /NCGR_SAMPLE_ID=MMETSP0434 /ASSEMBLY_ACC=CAM_ASM_000379 /LENGTH=166 /DNA_ID=CAMNT_0028184119 /DNA_START=615 /DNA_END=1115 /DNA_ORIENTATION=-
MAHFLFNVTDVMIVGLIDWKLGLHEFLEELVGDVLAGNLDGLHGVGQSVAFEHGHRVGDSLAGLGDQSRRRARREERQNGAVLERECFETECIEHDLSEVLLVLLLALQTVRHEHRGIPGLNAQLRVKNVLEQLRQPVPILDDTALDRVVQVVVRPAQKRIVAHTA